MSAARASPDVFTDVYEYAFGFACEPGQRSLHLDAAVLMLRVLFLASHPHLDPFTTFLAAQSEYRGINRDQWCSFLEFACTYAPTPDALTDYDHDAAWPVLLDDYVAWIRDGKPLPDRDSP